MNKLVHELRCGLVCWFVSLFVDYVFYCTNLYPEWPHWQCVGLAYPWTRVRATEHRAQAPRKLAKE